MRKIINVYIMVYTIQNVFFYKRLQCSIQFAAGFVEKLRQLFFSVNMSKPPIITSDRAVYLFFEFTMATISIATEIIIINSS